MIGAGLLLGNGCHELTTFSIAQVLSKGGDDDAKVLIGIFFGCGSGPRVPIEEL